MAAVRHQPSLFRGQKQPGHAEPARQLPFHDFGEIDTVSRLERIALIGLRGAGKSTLGSALTRRLGVPFVELDRLIEEQSGLTLDLVFDFHGQAGFRRLELQCLEAVLRRHDPFEAIRPTPAAAAEFSGPKPSR